MLLRLAERPIVVDIVAKVACVLLQALLCAVSLFHHVVTDFMPTPSLSEAREALAGELAEALVSLRDAEEARAFLTDLCTPAEVHALAERWYVARLLDEGKLTYRQIHDATGVSTTTIVRVARFLRQESHGGYRRLLDRMKEAA